MVTAGDQSDQGWGWDRGLLDIFRPINMIINLSQDIIFNRLMLEEMGILSHVWYTPSKYTKRIIGCLLTNISDEAYAVEDNRL